MGKNSLPVTATPLALESNECCCEREHTISKISSNFEYGSSTTSTVAGVGTTIPGLKHPEPRPGIPVGCAYSFASNKLASPELARGWSHPPLNATFDLTFESESAAKSESESANNAGLGAAQ